ncbi:MAG: hypothetical protein Q7R93_05730 [bacterium]|nr:hypothetical protein [bacterium]
MKKLLHQKQSEIFERIVNRNGKLFLVRFVVVERAGKLRGKVISCEAIESLSGSTKETSRNYLPILRLPRIVKDEGLRIKDCLISPFSSLEFFMSQMTRAPSNP